MSDYKRKKLTCVEKREWWGDGEWCDEDDYVEFEYKGYKSHIQRVYMQETLNHMFGGHLCGYVCVPQTHPYYQKRWEDVGIECHGGLTFFEQIEDDWVIGFDCAHAYDDIPSMGGLRKEMPHMTKYRNLAYCKEQCMSIIDQLIALDTHKQSGDVCNT